MCPKLFKLRFNTSIQETWKVSSFSQKNAIAFSVSKDQGIKNLFNIEMKRLR